MHWTYSRKYVRCGKAGCRSCPHGPYWYRYRHADGKTYCEYVGKRAAPEGEESWQKIDERWDRIFARRTATVALACEILGIDEGTSFEVARKVYRRLALEQHPDRGGDQKRFAWTESAWSYLRAARGW